MATHVIVGDGPMSATTARLLADCGHDVRVLTAGGAAPRHDRIRTVPLDVASSFDTSGAFTDAVTAAVDGAVAVYRVGAVPVGRGQRDWTRLAGAVLTAAQRTGAVHVGVSDLGVYGAVRGRVGADHALAAVSGSGHVQAEAWADALAAHRQGRVRAVDVRVGDLVGPHTDTGLVGANMWRMLSGRSVRWIGDAHAAYHFTAVADVARLLAVVGTDARAWGRAWHVPTPPAVDVHLLFREFAAMAGVSRPRIRQMPAWMLHAAGTVSPAAAALAAAHARAGAGAVVDATPTTTTFGIDATPLRHSLSAMLAATRGRETAQTAVITTANGVRC